MSTLSTSEGFTFGIYLEPKDVGNFPEGTVFPLFGKGTPIEVTAYQLGVNRCPNYQVQDGQGRCIIYKSRPLACKAFPVVSRTQVSRACPVVAQAVEGIDTDSLTGEIEAHREKMSKFLSPADEWMWPLNKKQWIRINREGNSV